MTALRAGAIAPFALLLAVQCSAVFHRYLVNDDYLALYTAWLKGIGQVPGVDFNVDSYSIIIDILAPLLGYSAGDLEVVYVIRMLFVALQVLVAWQVYRLSNRLCGTGSGLYSALVVLCATPMIYRGIDIRPDLVTTSGWLALFLLFSGPQRLHRRGPLLVGSLLLVLVTLNKFKAILIAGPLSTLLALEWIRSTSTERRAMEKSVLMAGAAAFTAFGAYVLLIQITDNLETFARTHLSLFGGIYESRVGAPHARGKTLLQLWSDNPGLVLAIALGGALRLLHYRRFNPRANQLLLMILACAMLSLLLNPAYYAYNLLTLVPLLGIVAGYPAAQLVGTLNTVEAFPRLRMLVAVALIWLPVGMSWEHLRHLALDDSLGRQLALHEFIQDQTPPQTPVFAFEGIGLYRPSTYHWRSSKILLHRYLAGQYSIRREIEETRPALLITSYRIPGWLRDQDRRFLSERYLSIAPWVMAPGIAMQRDNEPIYGHLVRTGRYRLSNTEHSVCLVDGIPERHGSDVFLTRGQHRLDARRGRCTLRFSWDRDALARLRESNPFARPYLIHPQVSS